MRDAGRFVDAVLVANNFHNNYWPTGTTYPIPISRYLLPAISTYVQAVNGLPTPYVVTLRPRSYRQGQFYAMLARYDDHAEIFYANALNTCWTRFVVAKELAHLVVDAPKHYTSDVQALVSYLISNPYGQPADDLAADHFAFFSAIELLMPKSLSSVYYGMKAQGNTDLQIAQLFKIPEKVVQLRLGTYRELFDHCYAALR